MHIVMTYEIICIDIRDLTFLTFFGGRNIYLKEINYGFLCVSSLHIITF